MTTLRKLKSLTKFDSIELIRKPGSGLGRVDPKSAFARVTKFLPNGRDSSSLVFTTRNFNETFVEDANSIIEYIANSLDDADTRDSILQMLADGVAPNLIMESFPDILGGVIETTPGSPNIDLGSTGEAVTSTGSNVTTVETPQNTPTTGTPVTSSGSITPHGPLDIKVVNNKFPEENPLSGLVLPMYHLRVGMIGLQDAIARQNGDLTDKDVIYLMGTAESYRNHDGAYYNIRSCSLEQITAPNRRDTLINGVTGIKMEVVEPASMNFHKDLRRFANQFGYDELQNTRVVFEVDYWFSGYDLAKGKWVVTKKIRFPFMILTNVRSVVNEYGTVHTLDFVPTSMFAYRPEEMNLDGGNLMISGGTFGEYLSNLAETMAEMKLDRTDGKVIRKYEFYGPRTIMEAVFDGEVDIGAMFKPDTGSNDHIMNVSRQISLIDAIYRAMPGYKEIRDAFLTKDRSGSFRDPRLVLSIISNTVYGEIDEGRDEFRTITHQYFIVPIVSFHSGPVKEGTQEVYLAPDNQAHRLGMMKDLGAIKKIYNYLYTSENTEVISVSLDLNTYYARSLYDKPVITPTEKVGVANSTDLPARSGATETDDDDQVVAGNTSDIKNRGPEGDPQRDASKSSFDDKPTRTIYSTMAKNVNNTDVKEFLLEYDDYFNVELTNIDMTIRGDPYWITGPYTSSKRSSLGPVDLVGADGGAYTGNLNLPVYTDDLVLLRVNEPRGDPLASAQSEARDSLITGLYKVLSLVSNFSADGTFTQTLNMVKLDSITPDGLDVVLSSDPDFLETFPGEFELEQMEPEPPSNELKSGTKLLD